MWKHRLLKCVYMSQFHYYWNLILDPRRPQRLIVPNCKLWIELYRIIFVCFSFDNDRLVVLTGFEPAHSAFWEQRLLPIGLQNHMIIHIGEKWVQHKIEDFTKFLVYLKLVTEVVSVGLPLSLTTFWDYHRLASGLPLHPHWSPRRASRVSVKSAFFRVWRFTPDDNLLNHCSSVNLASSKGFDPTEQPPINFIQLATFRSPSYPCGPRS